MSSNSTVQWLMGAAVVAVALILFSGVPNRPWFSVMAADEEPGLNHVLTELKQFGQYYAQQQQVILAKEKDYIAIAENPEEAQEQRSENRKLVQQTHRHIEAIEEAMSERIEGLDKKVKQVDAQCSGEVDKNTEKQCIVLHDHIQRYEAQVSTFTGMMEVMKRRYKEAKAALK